VVEDVIGEVGTVVTKGSELTEGSTSMTLKTKRKTPSNGSQNKFRTMKVTTNQSPVKQMKVTKSPKKPIW
jgi:hypothetical protein